MKALLHGKIKGQKMTISINPELQQPATVGGVAYVTLAPLVGKVAASILFAVALLASGQSSTCTRFS